MSQLIAHGTIVATIGGLANPLLSRVCPGGQCGFPVQRIVAQDFVLRVSTPIYRRNIDGLVGRTRPDDAIWRGAPVALAQRMRSAVWVGGANEPVGGANVIWACAIPRCPMMTSCGVDCFRDDEAGRFYEGQAYDFSYRPLLRRGDGLDGASLRPCRAGGAVEFRSGKSC